MLIGLTGSFGSGKSTILKMFERLGALTVSADKIVHQLLKRPQVKSEIKKRFGPQVFNGPDIDRKRLAKRIFSSETDRKDLEQILHPLVYKEVKGLQEAHPERIIVAEIPLLLESGRQEDFDMLVLVTCEPETAIKRLQQRGFSRQEAVRRLDTQMPVAEKVKRADYIIDNSGSMEEAERQVGALWKRLSTQGKGSLSE